MKKLSIIVPGIRPYNWETLYRSTLDSFLSNDFEMIFIGPYEPPTFFDDITNIKFIKDFGSPARAMNIGLVNSDSEYTTWAADDGFFYRYGLYNVYNLMDKSDKKHVITCQYKEGSGETMDSNEYYRINKSVDCNGFFIDGNNFIVNVGLINTEYLKDIGGWDSWNFDVAAVSHLDLAIRLHNDNVRMDMYKQIFECSHMPNDTGDHGPIHYTHILKDIPLLRHIYTCPSSVNRKKIDLNNWESAPDVWSQRFKGCI
jgi:hypothetical protein